VGSIALLNAVERDPGKSNREGGSNGIKWLKYILLEQYLNSKWQQPRGGEGSPPIWSGVPWDPSSASSMSCQPPCSAPTSTAAMGCQSGRAWRQHAKRPSVLKEVSDAKTPNEFQPCTVDPQGLPALCSPRCSESRVLVLARPRACIREQSAEILQPERDVLTWSAMRSWNLQRGDVLPIPTAGLCEAPKGQEKKSKQEKRRTLGQCEAQGRRHARGVGAGEPLKTRKRGANIGC